MKLSLDKTWTECLRMLKWISRKSLTTSDVSDLKEQYLEQTKYENKITIHDCFFCNYALNHCKDKDNDRLCNLCPALKYDKDFHCMDILYDYSRHPRKFYKKLKELNKIRLAGKK